MTVRSHFASTGPGVQTGRPFTPRLITLMIGAGILSLLGCAPRTAPSGLPAPGTAAPAIVAPPTPATRAIATPVTGARYTLQNAAIVQISADTMLRVDTLTSRSILRATPQGTVFVVVVDSHAVAGGGAPPRLLATDLRSVARRSDNVGWEFVGLGEPCASPASAIMDGTRDLWVRWPAQVQRGTEWRDTSRVALCRDGIPLTMLVERSYRVDDLPADPDSPVVLTRRSVVSMQGRGLLRADPTEIVGQGTGVATMYLVAASGWIDSLRTESLLAIEVRGTTRTQRITQQSQGTIQRTPERP